MDNRFGEQIGLPGNHFLKQQMQESGLEMSILDVFEKVLGAFSARDKAEAAQDAADDKAKYAKEMAKWSWNNLKDKESYAEYDVKLQRLNEENVRKFRDQAALDDYHRKKYIQRFQQKIKIDQYNASELQYAKQIDYNAMGVTLAKEEQSRWLEETLQQASFDTEDMILKHDQELKNIGFKQVEQFLKLAEARDTFGLTSEDLNLKQRSKRAEFAAKSMEGWQKKLQDEGKVRALGQAGRTGRKNRQSVLAMAGQQQAMLNSMVTRSDLSFSIEHRKNLNTYSSASRNVGLQRDILEAESDFASKQFDIGSRKIEATVDSTFAQNKANLLKIDHEHYGANMAAEGRRMSPPIPLDELPPIVIPYASPQVHIADSFVTKEKPPGPVDAPNMRAGASNAFAASMITAVGNAVSMGMNAGMFDGGSATGGVTDIGTTGAGTMSGVNTDTNTYFGTGIA